MKIEIHLSHTEQLAAVLQALSVLPETRKAPIGIERAACPKKSSPLREATKSHYRDFQVVREADNTLRDKVSGQTIPSTRRGGIDKKKLAQEILLGKWSHSLQ